MRHRRSILSTTQLVLAGALSLLLPRLARAQAGALDPSFDGDGRVTTDFNASSDSASALVLLPDGKLVASGSEDPQAANNAASAQTRVKKK